LAGILLLTFAVEPSRGQFDPQQFPKKVSEDESFQYEEDVTEEAKPSRCKQFVEGFQALVKNPCTRWILMGSMIRYWQYAMYNYYLILYFNYFDRKTEFSILFSIIIIVAGFSSNIIAGRVSDTLESVVPLAKTYVATACCLLGLPLYMLMLLVHSSFYLSVAMLFLATLLCEGWYPPVIAIVTTVIDVKYKAVSVGLFLFMNSISSAIATVIMG
jgi:hypothetical protein